MYQVIPVININNIVENDYGFAGFSEKEYLTNHLSEYGIVENNTYDYTNAMNIVTRAIDESLTHLPVIKGGLYIYLFLVDNLFIREKLNGISGFTPYANSIHLYIDAKTKLNVENLRATTIHEYTHSQLYHVREWNTILDGLFAEGYAEQFTSFITKKPSVYTSDKASEYYRLIRDHLKDDDFELYEEVFTKGEKYPLWTGYHVGYWMIDNYIKAQADISWPDLLQVNINDFMQKSEES